MPNSLPHAYLSSFLNVLQPIIAVSVSRVLLVSCLSNNNEITAMCKLQQILPVHSIKYPAAVKW